MDIGTIEKGKVIITILTANRVSITLNTEDRFNGEVIQPGPKGLRTTAEHGLAMSIQISDDEGNHTFLLDTGGPMETIIKNSEALKVDLSEVEKVIISHGHFDHFGGLKEVIAILKEGAEIILNPIGFIPNQNIKTKSGKEVPAEEMPDALKVLQKEGDLISNRKLPVFSRDVYINLANERNVKIIETNEPIKLCKGIITSGEIDLSDNNEVSKGFYLVKGRKNFEKHTFRDETSIYINIEGKGLVILTGCGHVGIQNTVKHAQKLTGINQVHAIIGGLHQEGKSDIELEEIVKYIEVLNPKITCGMHCTGFNFNKLISRHPSHTEGIVGTEFNL